LLYDAIEPVPSREFRDPDNDPEWIFNSVDLPMPFYPMIPSVSPFPASKAMLPGAKKILVKRLAGYDLLKAGQWGSGRA
jgi:hypothetical protein